MKEPEEEAGAFDGLQRPSPFSAFQDEDGIAREFSQGKLCCKTICHLLKPLPPESLLCVSQRCNISHSTAIHRDFLQDGSQWFRF